jgi:hypothetical protein
VYRSVSTPRLYLAWEQGNITMQSGRKIHVLIRLSEQLADRSTSYHRLKGP